MIEKLLGEYLPATLTFIVGVLGICNQLAINFLAELGKRRLEKNRIYNQNICEYYVPLLTLLREYNFYLTLLKKSDDFTLANWHYPGNQSVKKQFENLRRIYNKIGELQSNQHIPLEKELNSQIQNFIYHVISVNCLWEQECDTSIFTEVLGNNNLRGYDVKNLINLLEQMIGK